MSDLVCNPNCWFSHAAAQLYFKIPGSCDFFAISSMETYTVAYQDNKNNVTTQSMLLDQDVSYTVGQM